MQSYDFKTPWVFVLHQEGRAPRGYRISARNFVFFGMVFLVAFFSFLLCLFLLFHEVHKNYALISQVQSMEVALSSVAPIDRRAASLPSIQDLKAETLDFHFSCEKRVCISKWLIHSKSKERTQGKYLVVLETEFPKLGKVPAKKKFWSDPNNENIESLDASELQALPKKNFSFLNMMKITSVFSLNNLVNTNTLHFYLYDAQERLILHEAHPVEMKNEISD